MAKKNSKPYNNVKRDRTYSYNKKNNYNKFNSKNDKDLESTTRIRVDSSRLNDSESLDTSFLEGRVQNNSKVNKKKKEQLLSTKKDFSKLFKILKNIFYLGGSFTLLILAFLIINNNFFVDNLAEQEINKVEKKEIVKIIDNNYLFIGEANTKNFDFDTFKLDYHYINSGDDKLLLKDLLSNMKKKIYDFNPSIIFIQVGMNDIIEERSIDEVLKDLETLILKIKENRPYADIYLESFYPINKEIEDFSNDDYNDINNNIIIDYNKQLKDLCDSLDVNYLDVFSELSIDNQLNEEYTDDGIILNNNGYKRLYKIIRKIVDDNK